MGTAFSKVGTVFSKWEQLKKYTNCINFHNENDLNAKYKLFKLGWLN